MFKNIQDKLLISNPLLWNLKIVPFAIIALIFNILFFLLGYANGNVVFKDAYNYYDSNFDTGIVIFFSVIVSILLTIVWLVLYSRNNAFKSFYPKSDTSLFKEFLYIVLFCALVTSFTLSYLAASDFRTRNYFSEKEISKRLEILSLCSVFLEGSFVESSYENVVVDGQHTTKQRTDFQYKARRYSFNSLMNKTLENNTYYLTSSDSIMKSRVKGWLYENKKDSVKWVFDEFMKMAKEHNLKSNITSEKWLSLVYNYPKFEDYTIINKSASQDYYPYDEAATVEYASPNDTIPVVSVKQASSSYYVPYNALKYPYQDIAKAYQHPTIDLDAVYFYLYFAIGLAIAIFSFKVTSGRNWLIALVSLGVISLITGIFSVMSGGTTFLIFYILIFFGLLIHFFSTLSLRTGKGITGITLNQILWMCPGFIPALYYTVLQIAKSSSNYYNSSGNYVNGVFIQESFPKIEWMDDHFPEMMVANILFIVLFIFLFSVQIKKWKGIAEA